jgi:MoxR-like ATPase
MTDPLWPPDFPRQVTLPAIGHLAPPTHVFDARSAWAIVAAKAARRPLLVRGEPGTGKSQLARAAAVALKRAFVQEVITSRSEAHDLHWRFDAVARLGKAQAMGVPGAIHGDVLDERLYVSPGPLWWVFDWSNAETQHHRAIVKGARPPEPSETSHRQNGCVLLIDEIDKAESDVPNGLLESLGNGEFHVPYFSEPVKCKPDLPAPLVVITTNEERELPPAFVRRCLVLQLALPTGPALEEFLVARGRAHFGAQVHDDVYQSAAKLVADDRPPLIAQGLVAPGQAEYLDLLRAVLEHAGADRDKQTSVLAQVKDFVLDKNPAGAR